MSLRIAIAGFLYLDPHGAMVVDGFPDGEGELLRRVRAVVGDLPLTIRLDPHCNLTAAMVGLVDALVPVDPATLPFRHLRPGLRLRPMANAG